MTDSLHTLTNIQDQAFDRHYSHQYKMVLSRQIPFTDETTKTQFREEQNANCNPCSYSKEGKLYWAIFTKKTKQFCTYNHIESDIHIMSGSNIHIFQKITSRLLKNTDKDLG